MNGLNVTFVPVKLPFGWFWLLPPPRPLLFGFTEVSSNETVSGRAGACCRNWSPRTVRTYRQGLATLPPTLTKATLNAWVISQRQRGLTPAGLNLYARTINSYLSWLHEEGHISERLRIKLLPNPSKPLTTFSDADVRRILTFRPLGRGQLRS